MIELMDSNKDRKVLLLPPPLLLLRGLVLLQHKVPKLGLSMLLIGLLMVMMLMIRNVSS
jgi:hypothetical protein